MKKFLILTFLLVPTLSFASQNVFYDPISDSHIVDVSGQKTKLDIAEEFELRNIGAIQELTIDETQEAVRLENGTLVKYNYVLETKERAAAEKEAREYKESLVKMKLGLTDAEWVDLKEALGLASIDVE